MMWTSCDIHQVDYPEDDGCPVCAMKARVVELEAALAPFAFLEDETTQAAWETRYADRFKDWIDFDDIDRARAALGEN